MTTSPPIPPQLLLTCLNGNFRAFAIDFTAAPTRIPLDTFGPAAGLYLLCKQCSLPVPDYISGAIEAILTCPKSSPLLPLVLAERITSFISYCLFNDKLTYSCINHINILGQFALAEHLQITLHLDDSLVELFNQRAATITYPEV